MSLFLHDLMAWPLPKGCSGDKTVMNVWEEKTIWGPEESPTQGAQEGGDKDADQEDETSALLLAEHEQTWERKWSRKYVCHKFRRW